jgi:lipopolysaccharide export LptBFGC system permease protein LptF
MFLLVSFVVSTIVFVIDFLEFSPEIQKYSISPTDTIRIILFRIPSAVEQIIQFIVLLSVIFLMAKFLSKNELIVFYANGISEWRILILLSLVVFLMGLFSITTYNRNAVNLLERSNGLLKKYEGRAKAADSIWPSNGIWLRQSGEKTETSGENPEKYEIVTRADGVLLESLIFTNVILLVTDENGNFLRRINAKSMQIHSGNLAIEDAYVIERGRDIVFEKQIMLPVMVEENFVRRQIQNKYKNLETVDFLSLGKLIEDFRLHGLNTRRFEVKKNNMLLTPIMYVLMVLIGVLLSGNNPRDTKYLLGILKASMIGVGIFVTQNILTGLSLASNLGYSISTRGFVLFTLVLVCHRLIHRIELQNL